MQTIYDIFEFVQSVTDKQTAGSLTPDEFSTFLNAAQLEYFHEQKALRLQGDSEADNALKPFKVSATVVSDANGKISYPADYSSVDGIYDEANGTAVTLALDNELVPAIRSAIDPITSNPRYRLESAWIHMFPEEVRELTLAYIKKPNTPYLDVTVSGNTFSYNAGGSTQLDFEREYWPPIIRKLFLYLGVNLNDPTISGLSQIPQ